MSDFHVSVLFYGLIIAFTIAVIYLFYTFSKDTRKEKRKTPLHVTAINHGNRIITFDNLPNDISISDYIESKEGAVCLIQMPKIELNFVREHWLKRFLLWPVRKWDGLMIRKQFERAFEKAMKR